MSALYEFLLLAMAPVLGLLSGCVVCYLGGQRDLKRYLSSLPLVAFNLALVVAGALLVCSMRWSTGSFGDGDALWMFLGFFAVIDMLGWFGHWLVHAWPPLRRTHLRYHHAKREPYGLDQFYQHPLDNLLLFTVPGVVAFALIPIGLELGAFAFALAVFGNVLAHGPFGWEHRRHHLDEPVSLGGGVWFDWVMGTSSDTLGHKLIHWGTLVALYAAYRFWPWALLLVGLYLLFKLTLYHVTDIARVREFVWRGFYAAFDRILDWTGNDELDTMNWGFAAEPGITPAHPRDLHLALYRRVLGATALDANVLEVGSGRGGAAFALFEQGYRNLTGLDLSPRHVARCQARAAVPRFVVGNAQSMPFDDCTFDVVLNVESSHCYPDFDAFVNECHRVLRPGGCLRWCDFRTRDDWDRLLPRLLADPRWRIVEREELTPGVLRSCDLLTPWYEERLQAVRWLPPLHTILRNFACLRGSHNYRKFMAGEWVYMRLVLVRR
jgi:SAM-dependent methyltransferase/sterol desaturase/sphingolipid hydroxylase (fatty acid hydroxylase superfamily)